MAMLFISDREFYISRKGEGWPGANNKQLAVENGLCRQATRNVRYRARFSYREIDGLRVGKN